MHCTIQGLRVEQERILLDYSFPVGCRTHSRNNIITRPGRLVPRSAGGVMALLTSTFMDYLVKCVSETIEERPVYLLTLNLR